MRCVLPILIGCLMTAPLVAPAIAFADAREEAVDMARAGQLSAAVSMLERLYQERPEDDSVLFDLLTVLNWSGDHPRVMELSYGIDSARLPTYALRALALSSYAINDINRSTALYQQLIGLDDASDADYAGYARVLVDNGDSGHAHSVALSAVYRFGPSADNQYAMAYAYFSEARYAHAITHCQRVLEMDAEHAAATWLLVRSLERLGATGVAERVANERRSLLAADAQIHVANDRNATWVRWGAFDQGSINASFRDTDIALRRLETLEKELADSTHIDPALVNVMRFDRIVALHGRLRMEEAVTLYETLLEEGIAVPAYARRAVAGAYLYLRHPDQARDLYQGVIAEQPNDVEARTGLFYALLEAEDFSAARDVIEELVDELTAYVRSADGRHVQPNHDWLGASITAAMMEAYSDRLDRAIAGIRALRARAPHDARLHRELSTLYRWRGWANAALEQARIGRTNFPDDVGLALAEASALMDLRRYREAEATTETLFAELPEHRAVQRFAQDLESFHSPVLEAYYSRASSDADNVVRGERSLALGARLDSAPIHYHSRFFVAADQRRSTFPEGALSHRRAQAGYAYRYGNFHAQVSVTDSSGDLDQTGVTLHAGVVRGDHIGLDLRYDSVSLETPLRALTDGTHADRLQLSLGVKYHESRLLGLDLGSMDFSDGNRRDFASMSWQERWYAGPVYRLQTFVEGYGSRNSIDGVNYFNPESDRDVNLTLRQRWKTWRNYDRSFHQVLDLARGRYSQKGFDDGDTWSVRYEHTFEREDEYLLSYGIRRARDFYDGNPEYVNEVFIRYNRIY